MPLELKLTTERRTRVNWSRSINFRGLASHVGGLSRLTNSLISHLPSNGSEVGSYLRTPSVCAARLRFSSFVKTAQESLNLRYDLWLLKALRFFFRKQEGNLLTEMFSLTRTGGRRKNFWTPSGIVERHHLRDGKWWSWSSSLSLEAICFYRSEQRRKWRWSSQEEKKKMRGLRAVLEKSKLWRVQQLRE